MIENDIKAISQLLQKPLTEVNESDIQKIMESDIKDVLSNLQVIKYLMDNTNEWFSEFIEPLYIQLTYEETMSEIEKHLQCYNENPELYTEELKIQMESKLEKDNAIEVLAASIVLLSIFPDFDFGQKKNDIIRALTIIENLVIQLPLPETLSLISVLLSTLYFPVINLWYDLHNEVLVKENDSFREKLILFSELIDTAEDLLLSESEDQNG
jgi:hypothetical protein